MNLGGKAWNPGEMRTRIELLRPASTAPGPGGFQKRTYAVAAQVMAKWVNVHGSEVWAAEAQQAIAPATVTIRWRVDIDATWQVRKGGQVYEVVSLDNIQERNELIELKVRRATGG